MNMRGKRKIGRKILAFVLSVCMLFTVQPNLWDGVMVQAAGTVKNDIDDIMQTFLDRIAALSDAEEYLASEPDMEDEDAYAEWEEKLYEYAEEALVIWEEYEALTEEQHAQIPEEVLEKLTAWVELAETLSDHAVMLADNSEHHGESNWTPLTTSHTTLSGGKFYLSDENGDLTMGTITIDGDVTLCLNGHKLQHDSTDGSAIVVTNGTFTLCDCQDDWDYTSSFDESSKTYSCEVTGQGGCIIGGNGKNDKNGDIYQGGGVYVTGSNTVFNMSSGRITGGNIGEGEKHCGGGVAIIGGRFNMSGGFIDGNKASCGGGIYLDNQATFSLSGNAVIMNNEGAAGGGVYCDTDTIFNMTSGNILGNKEDTATNGGGVFVGTASFNMSGGTIEGNVANSDSSGSGVCCYRSNSVILSGGSIQHNISAGTASGGVRVSGTVCVSDSIHIFDNYNNGETTNLSLNSDSIITVTGELSNDIGITYRQVRGTVSYPKLVVTGTSSHSISDADWSHFSSDDKKYEIQKKETTDTGNELYLAEPGKCNLFNLTTDCATLSPSFDPNTTEYTSTVANSVNQVGITATLADASTATIKIRINGGTEVKMTSGTEEKVGLNVGKNTIVITVTSDGMSKTYTIEITREAAKGNPVTITAYKDGVEWKDTPLPTYKLKLTSDSSEPFIEDLTAVPDGTYRIYYDYGSDEDIDTGVEVKVDGAPLDDVKVYYHTVTFYDGDSVLAQQIVLKNKTASVPTDNPTKTGYTFSEWVTADGGSTVYDFTKAVTEKTSVYASWTLISYSITYVLGGGNVSGNPTSYTIESSTITLNNPTKEGYTFAGWSGMGLTDDNNIVVKIAAGSTGNREYTAHWTAADYTVTLNGDGGTGAALTGYTYGIGATLPIDWTKTGYSFAGWYDNKDCTGTAVTEISATDTGDKEYWAKWTPQTYQVTFHYHGADGGDITASQNVTYDSKYGTLPVPSRTGYTFKGWYTEENGKGSKVDADTTVKTTSAHTLHAYWLDETAPNKPVLQDGVTLPTGWTNAQDTIPLKLYDGVGVTALLVSVDGSPYTEVSGFSGGTGSMTYDYPSVQEGEHIYQFKAVDAAGNFAESDIFTVKLDQTKPVIGTLTYDNAVHLNFWHWIIGKESIVIHVPVTDTGSGVTEISYTLTPRDAAGNLDAGKAETKTAMVMNGEAKITFDKDFRGTIAISCTDAAGNAADGVTIGKDAGGIIIEDNAPQIAFQAENAELLQTTGEYKTAPDITVTVTDNKDNAISAGIASVSYKIGNGSAKTVPHDYLTGMVVHDSFTIPASEIPAGETEITVTATDNAGNSVTQNYTVKVHTHSGTLVPAVEPTCTTAGNKEYYTCTCGKWFSDSGCTNEITDHTEVVKKALGHDFTGKYQFDTEEHWMKCSRCTATDSREAHSFGEGSNRCTKCEFEKAGEGHTHTGELHERVEPTCTTKGNTAYYTCNCGKWFSDSSCTVEITDKSKIEIAALEHDFVMKHDQNEHWQQCSRCSLEQSRGLHEYDDDSDTDCNVCGFVRTIQHTHSGALVPAVEPTCTEDGHEAYYTCTCGKWFSDSGCVNEITDHASVTVEKRGHDFSGGYQSDENGHWKVCARCNVAQAAESHVFDDEYDTDCNQCGYRRNIGNQGNVSKDVEKDEKAPDTVLSDSAKELADIILTEEEKGQIGNGTDIKFILNVKDAGDTVSSGDRTAVQQALDGNTAVKGFSVGQYLDISLFKVIGDTRSAISQTARKLTIVINVPESLKSKDSAKPRTYAIIRVHDGVAEVLADLDGDADTVTIATDRFSAYALVYKEAGSGADVTPTPTPTPGGGDQPTPTPGGSDKPSPTPGGREEPTPTPGGSDKPSPTPGGKDNVTPAPSPSEKPEKASGKEKRKIEIHSGLKAIQTGKKLQISWGRVTGADGYSVYVQYCGKDFSAKSLNQVKSGKKTKITVKKVNGKKLDTTKNFKLYVVAWQWKNGKKSTLTKTLTIHVAGKDSVKYTNVKSIQVKKSSYTLKKGGTVTLHPKAVLYDKRKKQLSVAHCKEFRYLSSNKKVATVTAGGKVKAKGTGECTIYVFAKNGCRRKIKIKVKK